MKTKMLRRIWAEIRIVLLHPDAMITRTDKAHKRWAESFLQKMKASDSLDLARLLEWIERQLEYLNKIISDPQDYASASETRGYQR